MNKVRLNDAMMAKAFELFDSYNQNDPSGVTSDGLNFPATYFYALKLHDWVLKLDPHASDVLLLACRESSLPVKRSSDTSVSRSTQLDYAIPASKISSLSSGEFVGMVADNPDSKIELKVFHSEIQNDHEAIRQEEAQYQEIPKIRTIDSEIVQINYLQIKQDIQELLVNELGSAAEGKSMIQNIENECGGGIIKGMKL